MPQPAAGEAQKAAQREKAIRKGNAMAAARDKFQKRHAENGLHLLRGPAPGKEAVGPSGQPYHGRSLLCLYPATEPRRSLIFLVEWCVASPTRPFAEIICAS